MTTSLWPWLAVAAAGALHGLNPATGWALVACCARDGGGTATLRALLPVGAGHLASVIVVAAAVPAALLLRVEFSPLLLQGLAGALLLALAVRHFCGKAPRQPAPAGHAALALWSFIVGTAHGAGWMLVPALVPLCASDLPAREITATGSMGWALAAIGVHMAAMLGTTAAMAALARRGFDAAWVRGTRARMRALLGARAKDCRSAMSDAGRPDISASSLAAGPAQSGGDKRC